MKLKHLLFNILFLTLLEFSRAQKISNHSFTVDYDQGTFLKDGKPFRYISGCMHYFRVPQIYWRDRLLKMKACGLDAVETYIPWNFHWQGTTYDFTGQRDVVSFFNMAHEVGLLAIVRGFPFSDTEWDMGGLPYWLLRTEYNPLSDPMILRTNHPKFMTSVKDWLDVILPKLKPLLYNNNGPIIMVQIENEYGSYYAHDGTYMKNLYSMINSQFDGNVVLFTTDGNSANDLEYGGVSGALHTVDFGPGSDPNTSFQLLKKYQPKGPAVNSEYYTGWLDHWSESSHHRASSSAICKTLNTMLSLNASVNFYMFVGGTNFEYWSGSNYPPLKQVTTSYDYDSPVSENGDTTDKYFAIRDTISKYKTLPSMPIPSNITRMKYGKLPMAYVGQLWDYLLPMCPNGPTKDESVKTFEDLAAFGGYVLYTTKIPSHFKKYERNVVKLQFENEIRDYAQIYINQTRFMGTLERNVNKSLVLGDVKAGDRIDILVESRGRICVGTHINDSKGISGEVKITGADFDEIVLKDWEMCHLELKNLANYDFKKQLAKKSISSAADIPGIYTGKLYIPTVADTFIEFLDGNWTNGYVIANGFNLGKFEPTRGPQKTLYLPTKAFMKESESMEFIIFETRSNEYCSTLGNFCMINFVDNPNLG